MTYQECYDEGKKRLAQAGIEEAPLDARLLLEFVCGTDRNTLLVHGDLAVSGEAVTRYRELVEKRVSRIPLQHLTGEQDFMGLSFLVNRDVLIPRQDTEILVEEVLRELQDGMRILDLCTGSGCILISLLHYSNDCFGLGVDLSPEALATARENARRILGADCLCEADSCEDSSGAFQLEKRISFLHSDLFERVSGKFDLIVSNPPYIASGVIETLEPEVREHEPRMALDGSADGLEFYRRITEKCGVYLMRGGQLFFEIGCDQGEAVSGILMQNGFDRIRVTKDYAGLDRVVSGVYMAG